MFLKPIKPGEFNITLAMNGNRLVKINYNSLSNSDIICKKIVFML